MYTHLARDLRAVLADQGIPLSHSHALELLAHLHGLPDWNTLCKARHPTPWSGTRSGPPTPP